MDLQHSLAPLTASMVDHNTITEQSRNAAEAKIQYARIDW